MLLRKTGWGSNGWVSALVVTGCAVGTAFQLRGASPSRPDLGQDSIVSAAQWSSPSVGDEDGAVAGVPGACCDPATGECADAVPEALCEAGGGIYQGGGSACAACFGGPMAGAPCRACTIPAGAPCDSDADCAVGGSCEPADAVCAGAPGVCTAGSVGAACMLAADCAIAGDCAAGTCVAGMVGAACVLDADCDVPGICSPPFCAPIESCSVGACCDPAAGDCSTTAPAACMGDFLGFGTTCDPNCCAQPSSMRCMGGPNNLLACTVDLECGTCVAGAMAGIACDEDLDCPGSICDGACEVRQTGADDCEDAYIHVITVPSPGYPPKVVTISGNNMPASSTATRPDSCFPPNADVGADEGWWEALAIDGCALVRVDHCCSDPVHTPARPLLYADCPCGAPISASPNPYAVGQAAYGYGDPYCAEDNFWATFQPLPAGVYYYGVHSSPAGTRGPYQLHLTVEACPLAACCYLECSASPILCATDADCPAGETCDSKCSELNKPECDGKLGNHLAPPQAYGGSVVALCTPGVCDSGSCCLGPGMCADDRETGGAPMTKAVCDAPPYGGTFAGGLRCRGGTCAAGADAGLSCSDDGDCPGSVCLGTPEELAQRSPCGPSPIIPDPAGEKNRAISFSVPPVATANSFQWAIRVTMIDLQNPVPPNLPPFPPPVFGDYEVGTCIAPDEGAGCARWVGPPATFLESNDLPGLGSFRGARLQCAPYYHAWGAEGLVHVFGAEIVPSSLYDVEALASSCKGTEDTCAAASMPVAIATRRWGDVALPYNPPSTTVQPNALDVVALVNKFKNLVGALSQTAAQLQPNVLDLNADVNALDISSCVNAFRGSAYPFSGPCGCPSAVPCDATPCVGPPACVALYGAGAQCVRTCVGGPNDGLPCNNVSNCNYCVGGVFDGQPCNPATPATCPAPGVCPGVGVCPAGGFCRDACGRCFP